MATVGRGVFAQAVHEFFEGIRTYDVDRAVAVLAEDADFQSPWNDGVATGRDPVREILKRLLEDAATRPSFTIIDIAGDGSLVTLTVSVSGRFGKAARPHLFRILHLKGQVHQVVVQPA